MFIVFLARFAGKILQFLRSNVRFGSVASGLGKYRGKRPEFGRLHSHEEWEKLHSLAVPLRSETEIDQIYARCALGWPTLARVFSLARCVRGAWKRLETANCANLRSPAVPLGSCANACLIFCWACCARGGRKLLENQLAQIYVRSLCHWAVAPTLP